MWEEKLKTYDDIVSKCTRFKRLGKTMPYTSANGYMFSALNKNGELGIRFSKEVQEAYFKKFNTSYFLSYGSKMNGYVRIPEEMLKDTDTLVKLLNESYDYVLSLPKK